jgi:hypothetical protein
MTASQTTRTLQRTPRKAAADLNYAGPIRTHRVYDPGETRCVAAAC